MAILYWLAYAAITVGTIVLGANMWRWGGDGQSLWRNPGVPILVSVAKLGLIGLACLMLGNAWNWWSMAVLLYIPALYGMLQGFSYGVNAPIHKLWVWIFGQGETGNYPPVEIATRCTCGFLWSIPAAIFALFGGSWIIFGIYSIFLTIACGYIWWKYQDVEVAERATGGSVCTSIFV